MTREDIVVMLTGIVEWLDSTWYYADDEEQIDLDKAIMQDFDSSEEQIDGICQWLEDLRSIEEIRWSIDICLNYLREVKL